MPLSQNDLVTYLRVKSIINVVFTQLKDFVFENKHWFIDLLVSFNICNEEDAWKVHGKLIKKVFNMVSFYFCKKFMHENVCEQLFENSNPYK